MIIGKKFTRSLLSRHGNHAIYTDGGKWYDKTCNIIGLKYYIHYSREKFDGKSLLLFETQNRDF